MEPLLDHFLEGVRLAGAQVCGVTATAPWCIELAPTGGLTYHVVVEGEALLTVAPQRARVATPGREVRLRPGDVALVRSPARHSLRSDRDAVAAPLAEVERRTVPVAARWKSYDGGGGAVSASLCGTLLVDPALKPLLAFALPDVAVASRASLGPGAARLPELIMGAMVEDRPGAAALTRRYVEVLLLEAVRALATDRADRDAPPSPAGLLAARREPRIARAVAAFHAAPGAAWTIGRLAAEAGMSPSAFKAAFNALLGRPPHAYVLDWRLANAARQLRHSNAGIARLSGEAGFAS